MVSVNPSCLQAKRRKWGQPWNDAWKEHMVHASSMCSSVWQLGEAQAHSRMEGTEYPCLEYPRDQHGDTEITGVQGKDQPKARDLCPWCFQAQTHRMDQNNQNCSCSQTAPFT